MAPPSTRGPHPFCSAPATARVRAFLDLLASAGPEGASAEAIIDRIWQGRRPPPDEGLRQLARQARAVLAAGRSIVRECGRYVLLTPPGDATPA